MVPLLGGVNYNEGPLRQKDGICDGLKLAFVTTSAKCRFAIVIN